MNKLKMMAILIILASCGKDEVVPLPPPIEHFDFAENALGTEADQQVIYSKLHEDRFLILDGYSGSPCTADRNNKLLSAVYMGGEDEFLYAENYTIELNDSREISFAIWLWTSSLDGPLDAPIISVYDGNYYQLLYLEDGLLKAYFNDVITNVNEPIESGRWNHIALTFKMDDPYEFRLYINGQHRHTGDFSSFGFPGENWQNFQIGHSFVFPGFLAGHIDDLKIYNEALSAKEIAALYASEKP